MATAASEVTTASGSMAADARAGIVALTGLTRRFGERVILAEIDLTISAGQFVALLGRSGSGKSTMLRALARIDHEVEGNGSITVPANRSVIFQDARLLPWQRVLDNVLLGLPGRDAREKALLALDEVGLAGRERAWPRSLSGGEQQRVALARALVREPALLLADEPFGALDALTRLRMHALLRRLCEVHSPAVVLVTHDVDEAILLADRILVLDGGKIVYDVAVSLPNPPRSNAEQFAALRLDLLRVLGVDELGNEIEAR